MVIFTLFDDTWSDPNLIKTIEGVGFYPQAKKKFFSRDFNFILKSLYEIES